VGGAAQQAQKQKTTIEDILMIASILNAALTVALVVFACSAGHSYVQHRKKTKASTNLIRLYARMARDEMRDAAKEKQLTSELGKVNEGNPYGEPDNDYTPVFCYTRKDELSFEQISEILRYLDAYQQKLLLEYFFAQSAVDATIAEINTDYFRGVPQERKYAAIKTLQSEAAKLESAAHDLHIALGPRRQRPKRSREIGERNRQAHQGA